MAKTSSSKKVARVARTGGSKRRVRERPKMGFGLACFVIIVLGTLTVVFARTQRLDTASAAEQPAAPKGDPSSGGTQGDHWHVAYGMYVCDHFLPPVTDAGEDKNGIHTHGDGVIHTHPFNQASAGSNARLKVFGDQTGIKFGKDSITTPDGTVYDSNYKCGDKPAKVYVYRWPSATDPSATAEVFSTDFGQVRIKDNFSAMTFAVVPEGTDPSTIPKPESVSQLSKLTDLKPGDPGYTGAGAGAGGDPTAGLDPTAGIQGGTPGISTPGQPITPGGATPGAATPGAATPGAATPGAPGAATPSAPAGATPGAANPAAPASPAPSTP